MDYFALDLSLSELQRTLAQVPRSYRHVSCHGLHGTYDDGLAWLQLADNLPRSKFILSLGSSIGNFTRSDAAGFLAGFARILGPHDRMLIGLDACKDPDKVYHAYNDREGVTHRFVMNGLNQANLILDKEVFKPSMWKIIGEYDELEGRHQAFYSPTVDVEYDGINFHAGERVKVEESYKFSKAESDTLWADAGLIEVKSWANQTSEYCESSCPHVRSLERSHHTHHVTGSCPTEETLLTSSYRRTSALSSGHLISSRPSKLCLNTSAKSRQGLARFVVVLGCRH